MNKEEKNSKTKSASPIYLSVFRLNKLIELVSNRTLSVVKAEYFRTYDFSTSDSFLAVSSLKFLGLVDENNTPTETMSKLRLQGEARKKAFKEIVQKAYKEIFSVNETPYNLSSEDLSNEFVAHYKLSRGLLSPAVTAFRFLCEEAGLLEEGSVTIQQKRPTDKTKSASGAPRQKKSTTSSTETSTLEVSGFAPVPVAEGRMTLIIPSKLKDKILDDETLSKDWSTLRKQLHDFADKYIPKQEQKSEEKPDAGEDS